MQITSTLQVLVCLTITSSSLTSNYKRVPYPPGDSSSIGQYEYSAAIKYAMQTKNESTNNPVAIKFETDENIVTTRNLRVESTPKCDELEGKQGYCTEDPEYNSTIENLFNKLIEKIPSLHVVTDVLKETIIEEENGNFPNLRNRVGFSSEQTLCASVETIIYPKRGQTSKKDWVFILNQGPVQQGVKVEKCLKPNGACVLGGGPIELTACRQKYIYKKLLALDTSGHNIVSESIYMPSCCVCYVSNDFVSTRSSFRTRLFSANTANKTKD